MRNVHAAPPLSARLCLCTAAGGCSDCHITHMPSASFPEKSSCIGPKHRLITRVISSYFRVRELAGKSSSASELHR